MKRILRIVVLVLLTSCISQSFGQRKYLDIADGYYAVNKYREAIDYYKLALDERIVVNKYYMLERLADTHYRIFDYENAAKYYKELTSYLTENKSENLLNYGMVLMNLGEYEEARTIFNIYAERDDAKASQSYFDDYISFALNNASAEDKAKSSKTNIETGRRSLGLAYTEDGLLYGTPQTDKYNEKTIYYDLASIKMQSPTEFEEPLELASVLNGPFYEGTPYLFNNGTELIFSSNSEDIRKYKPKKMDKNELAEDGRNILKLYYSKKVEGEWTEPEELNINAPNANTVFPFLSDDGQTLFFSSDREGSVGGYDIWYAEKTGENQYGNPVNLGSEVNTFLDETYPYLRNSRLYFSSKGHPGYGGADMFVTSFVDGQASNVQNMGKPFNSSKDDFSLIIDNEQGYTGYFSSNREGNSGYDYIYYFYDYRPFEILDGTVINKETGEKLEGIKASLFKKDDNDNWVLEKDKNTDADGYWSFEIDPNEIYKVEFTHPEVVSEEEVIPSLANDDGGHRSKVIKDLKEVELEPVVKILSGVLKDAQTGLPIEGATVELYELNVNGKRTLVETQVTESDGEWKFVVDPSKSYEVDFIHPELGSKTYAVEGYDGNNNDRRNEQIEKLKNATLNDSNENVLSGTILDKITEEPVSGVTVTLYEKQDGEWVEVNAVKTGSDGKWSFDVDPNREYKVDFEKNGYEKQAFEIPAMSSQEERDNIILSMNPFEMKRTSEKDNLIRVNNIYFDFGRSHPQDDSYKILDNIYEYLKDNPDISIELSAHTDAVGRDSFNKELSQARADVCKSYLVKKGIKSSRIKAVGYGESKILNGCVKWDDCSEEENQVNRRVEIKVL